MACLIRKTWRRRSAWRPSCAREGAVAATIGVIGGQIIVGLSQAQIEHLATAGGVRKVSRRDLPIVVAEKLDGATTVAATAWAAHRAGIEVFATGGIGGVHRGQPLDVSADLPELAGTPVLVVCAGAKAILDLPLTLEWLETHGVPVIGYKSHNFPAFYHRDSGLPLDQTADSPAKVATLYRAQRSLGLPGGMLVTVPVPPGAELPGPQMEGAISRRAGGSPGPGHQGPCADPLPVGPHQRADRRSQPACQPRPARAERARRGPNRRGPAPKRRISYLLFSARCWTGSSTAIASGARTLNAGSCLPSGSRRSRPAPCRRRGSRRPGSAWIAGSPHSAAGCAGAARAPNCASVPFLRQPIAALPQTAPP